MNFYKKELLENFTQQKLSFIEAEIKDHVLTLTLNREEKRNALHPQMVNEIAFVLNYAHICQEVWALVIKAKGKVFCAGADLKAFAGATGTFESTIPEPLEKVLIGELFHAVHKPIISVVEGDVYAGGLFFIAGSNFVVAADHIQLGVPEVKRGIYPFQVMNELLKVMPARKVINWCITGSNMSAQEALEVGLITHLEKKESVSFQVEKILQLIKSNSPTAIRYGLEAYEQISKQEGKHAYLMQMLQKTLKTEDAREGILAFKEKRKPQWTGE